MVQLYPSTHPLGHTGPVTGKLYFYLYHFIRIGTDAVGTEKKCLAQPAAQRL